jgi:murein DD-endopeptidase MepM/ murein hydrolase activator NlpD
MVLVELLVCLIVAWLVISLLQPVAQRVWAADRPTPQRPVRVVKFPTPDLSLAESAAIYISVTEFQPTPTQPNSAQKTDTPPVTSTPLPANPLSGQPVSDKPSQDFGCSAYYTGIAGPGCPSDRPWFHDGLDLSAPAGTSVQAIITGTVIFAGPDGDGPVCGQYRGYGLGVIVDNGQGWQALYAHLTEIKVTTGQVVTPDTFIGLVGATGCVSGSHLHLGLRYQGQLVDPAAYLFQ